MIVSSSLVWMQKLWVEVVETQPNEVHLTLGGKGRSPELQRVMDRAESDPAFRRQLQASPTAVLEEALGERLPKGLTVRIHEPAPDCLRLFLPAAQSDAAGELSDADLAAVAGGGLFKRFVDFFCADVTTEIHTTNEVETFTDYSKYGSSSSTQKISNPSLY